MAVDTEAPPPVIRVMAYSPENLEEREIRDLESIPELLEKWPVTWINVDGLGHEPTIRRLGEIFDLHRLAIADVVNVYQRAKVEDYPGCLFIVTRMVLDEGELHSEQISMFLGKNYVLTFQERPGDCLDPVRERIRKGAGRIRQAGPDYLAYAILDAVVDHYFPVLEEYGERLEDLEDTVITRPTSGIVSRVHKIRRELLSIRRAVWPKREAVNSLMRESTPLVTDETRLYLRDVYDHAVQVIDLVENYRDIASGLMEAYLSSVSNRMNEIMKVLSVFATIFIPLTFIAGIYGMNFDDMPELHWKFGYPLALGFMVVIAVVMLAFFRRAGWFGGGSPRRGDDKDPPDPS